MGGDAKNILGALLGEPQAGPTPNPLLSAAGLPAGVVRNVLSGPGYADLPLAEQLANALVMAGGAAATEGKSVPGVYAAFGEAAQGRAAKRKGQETIIDVLNRTTSPDWAKRFDTETTIDSSGKTSLKIKNRKLQRYADSDIAANPALAEAIKTGQLKANVVGTTPDGELAYEIGPHPGAVAEEQAFGAAVGRGRAEHVPVVPGGPPTAPPEGLPAPAGMPGDAPTATPQAADDEYAQALRQPMPSGVADPTLTAGLTPNSIAWFEAQKDLQKRARTEFYAIRREQRAHARKLGTASAEESKQLLAIASARSQLAAYKDLVLGTKDHPSPLRAEHFSDTSNAVSAVAAVAQKKAYELEQWTRIQGGDLALQQIERTKMILKSTLARALSQQTGNLNIQEQEFVDKGTAGAYDTQPSATLNFANMESLLASRETAVIEAMAKRSPTGGQTKESPKGRALTDAERARMLEAIGP